MNITNRHLPASFIACGATLTTLALGACSAASSSAAPASVTDGGTTAGDSSINEAGSAGTCHPAATPSSCAPSKIALAVPTKLPHADNATNAASKLDVNGLVAADVDGDGKADLVAVEGDQQGGGIDVYLSKGGGTFAPPKHYDGDPGNADDAVVGDFNGDCIPDIFAISVNSRGNFYAGKGDGTFAALVDTGAIPAPDFVGVKAADLNGDGKLDIIALGRPGDTGLFAIGLGVGDGTFAFSSMAFDSTQDGGTFALADITGDGLADIVFVGRTNGVCYAPNSGTGSFGAAKCTATTPGMVVNRVASADFDGDGKVDVVANFDPNATIGLNIFKNTGGGVLAPRVEYASKVGSASLLAVDANNDGKADIVVYDTNEQELDVVLNDGHGSFADPVFYPAGGTSSQSWEPLVSGDFNGSGLVGFAVNNRSAESVDVAVAVCKP